ncbi:Ppx/GppA phosphatase family protein [Candidatus Omnitrophota bacterium]
MNIIGIIDIGSNTIHLDVIQVRGHSLNNLLSHGAVIKLGIYLSQRDGIPRAKIIEAAKIVKRFKYIAKVHGAEKVVVFATSILRKVAHREAVVRAIEKESGLIIDVISPLRELICLEYAGRKFTSLKNGPILLVDIGGGSTEFVLFSERTTFLRKSYSYGLAYVKGKYNVTTFSDNAIREKLVTFFDTKLQLFKKACGRRSIGRIIGTSSVIKTMSLLKYGNLTTSKDARKRKITYSDLIVLQKKFIQDPQSIQLSPERKDLVFMGTFFFIALLKITKKSFLEIGPYSVREGYLLRYGNVLEL